MPWGEVALTWLDGWPVPRPALWPTPMLRREVPQGGMPAQYGGAVSWHSGKCFIKYQLDLLSPAFNISKSS